MRCVRKVPVWLALVRVLTLSGCADDPVCVAGTTLSCVCSNDASGAQSCNSEGSGYEACVCGGGSASSGTSSSAEAAVAPGQIDVEAAQRWAKAASEC